MEEQGPDLGNEILREPLEEFQPEPAGPQDRREGTPIWVFVLLGLALLLLIVGFFFLRRDKTPAVDEQAAVESEQPAAPEEAAPETAAPQEIAVPSLAESDVWMREVVAQLSSHPELVQWLATDELVRNFTVVVTNFAEGESPKTHITFMAPGDGFTAGERGGKVVIDRESYERYDLLAGVVESLDTAGSADLYRAIKPLIDESYRDLGYPSSNFDATLTMAIQRLLRTPLIEGDVALEPKVSSYGFADPELEALPAAQKHLLRMGPDNLRRIQRKAREIALALGIPDSELPRTPVYGDR